METQFKAIPGFKKYEAGSDRTVRSTATKKLLVQKKGTGKYYIENDAGKRVLINIDEIMNITFLEPAIAYATKTQKAKTKKSVSKNKAAKKPEMSDAALKAEYSGHKKVRDILAAKESKDRKIFRLHKLGLTNHHIAVLTDSSKGNVSRGIWMFNNGHRSLV